MIYTQEEVQELIPKRRVSKLEFSHFIAIYRYFCCFEKECVDIFLLSLKGMVWKTLRRIKTNETKDTNNIYFYVSNHFGRFGPVRAVVPWPMWNKDLCKGRAYYNARLQHRGIKSNEQEPGLLQRFGESCGQISSSRDIKTILHVGGRFIISGSACQKKNRYVIFPGNTNSSVGCFVCTLREQFIFQQRNVIFSNRT